ncbi:MAG: 50S ribosomal protein L21 [Chloroflexi bacterium RBG_16_48_7]|nr:MAG: 50S ribosomal protein L21 [Chloroflexi bacterium RBG_16_48_7]
MKKDLYAIIETGGKQYKVSPGDKVEVDFLNVGNGKDVELEKVLFIADSGDQIIGKPVVEKAKVTATCLEESKGEKVIVFKYKNKVRYRRKKGHRQLFSKLEIRDIIKPDGKAMSKPKKAKATAGGNS